MAFQLLPNDYIRFLPSADPSKRNGSASLKYRVWDGTAHPCQLPNTGKHAHLLAIAVTVVILVVVMLTSSKLQSVIYCWSFSLSSWWRPKCPVSDLVFAASYVWWRWCGGCSHNWKPWFIDGKVGHIVLEVVGAAVLAFFHAVFRSYISHGWWYRFPFSSYSLLLLNVIFYMVFCCIEFM